MQAFKSESAYQPANLPSYLPICKHSCQPAYQTVNLPKTNLQPAYPPICLPIKLPTWKFTYLLTCRLANLPTCILTCLPVSPYLQLVSRCSVTCPVGGWCGWKYSHLSPTWVGADLGKKKQGGRKKITAEIVANNFVDSRPPNSDQLQRWPLVPIIFEPYTWYHLYIIQIPSR